MRLTIGHHSLLLHSSPQCWCVHLLCWWDWLVAQDLLAGSRAGSQGAAGLPAASSFSLKMPHPSPTNTQQLLSSWAIQIAPLPQHEDVSWALKQNVFALEGCQGLPTETCPSISLGCQTAKHNNSSHSDRLMGQGPAVYSKEPFSWSKEGLYK